MASPQKENGYTPIANELLEAIYGAQLNATQLKIILQVCRFTYGFSRKEHHLSLNFIAKGTNVHKNQVSRELSRLIERKILLEIAPATFSKSRKLSLNKNYDSWLSTETVTVTENVNPTVTENVNPTVTENVNPTVTENVNQESKYLKQNIKQGDVVFSIDSNPFKAALYLKSKIAENHPRQPLPPDDPESSKAQSWAQTMDLLNRLGPPGGSRGYGWPEIWRLIDFATSDPFWQNNILSAQKFRAQIVRLEAKAKQEASKEAGRGCHSPEHKRLGGASR